jgi:hypothetical protein
VIVDAAAPPWLMLIALGDADKLKSPVEASTVEEVRTVRALGETIATGNKNSRKRTGPNDKTYPQHQPVQMIYGLPRRPLRFALQYSIMRPKIQEELVPDLADSIHRSLIGPGCSARNYSTIDGDP